MMMGSIKTSITAAARGSGFKPMQYNISITRVLLLVLLLSVDCSTSSSSTVRPPLIIVAGSLHSSLWLCDDTG